MAPASRAIPATSHPILSWLSRCRFLLAHELGDHEVFHDEQDEEDEQAVAEPLGDHRSPEAG